MSGEFRSPISEPQFSSENLGAKEIAAAVNCPKGSQIRVKQLFSNHANNVG